MYTICSLAVILLIEFWARGMYYAVKSGGKWTHRHCSSMVVIFQSRLLLHHACIFYISLFLQTAKAIICQEKRCFNVMCGLQIQMEPDVSSPLQSYTGCFLLLTFLKKMIMSGCFCVSALPTLLLRSFL